MNIYAAFKTDEESEESGKWFEDILGDGTNLAIRVRRGTAKVVEKTRNRLIKEYRKFLVKGQLSDAKNEELAIEILAQAALVDWKGIKDADDVELPFSVEAARKLLTDLPNFRRVVGGIAGDMEFFRAEAQAEIEGN